MQKFVQAIGRDTEKFERVYNDKRPVHIIHPTKNELFLYFPDVRFETRTGKVYIFEVMDTEVGKQALVVAHVLQAILTPNVIKVFFIVQTARAQEVVVRITDTILGKLSDMGLSRAIRRVRFYHVVVSRVEARSYDRVAKVLAETGEIPTLT